MLHHVRLSAMRGRFRQFFEADARPQLPFARLVDRAVANGSPEPPGGVRGVFDAAELLIKLQKHVLGELLGRIGIAQKARREADHHGLVVIHDPDEIKPHDLYYGPAGQENARSGLRATGTADVQ